MQKVRDVLIIDLFGINTEEELRSYPHIYQRIYNLVRPSRLEMKDKARRERWWLFGRSNKEIRQAISGLARYIATCRTTKHRVFLFLDGDILPDTKVVAIGINDSFHLGILSSRPHIIFAQEIGGWLGVGNDPTYNNADCFNKFPFPDCDVAQKARIRELGERLDAHRKRQQALHPTLTMTEMYNVLERLRTGEPLTEKERVIHEQGLISVLKQLHDELDTAVFAAYGWSPSLTYAEILERLVALNRERADEERRGTIRWLRPEYQNRQTPTQTNLGVEVELSDTVTPATKAERLDFPKNLAEQARAVRSALAGESVAVTAEQLSAKFKAKKNLTDRISELLQTLALLGQAREVEEGKYLV